MPDTTLNPSDLIVADDLVSSTNPLPVTEIGSVAVTSHVALSPRTWMVNGAIVSTSNPLPLVLISDIDVSAISWRDAVVANGGSVSALFLAYVSEFIVNLKGAGLWAVVDDLPVLVGENITQCLVSLKQLRLGVNHGAACVPYAGLSTAATNSYVDLGFIPSINGALQLATDCVLLSWENANLNQPSYSIGGGNTVALYLDPLAGTSQMSVRMSSGDTLSSASSVTDSRGLIGAQRVGTTVEFFHDGASLGTAAAGGTVSGNRADASLYLGARNVSGTPLNFRSNLYRIWWTGASLSAALHASLEDIVNVFFDAIPAASIYVATTGSDSNPGTVDLPLLTPNAALNAAIPRAEILFQNGAFTLTATNISQEATMIAVNSRLAILTGTGTSFAMFIAPTAGETISLDGLIVDPSVNASGPGANAINIRTEATVYDFEMTDCLVRGFTNLGIADETPGNYAITLTDVDFTSPAATAVSGAISLDNMGPNSSVVISGGITTIAIQKGNGSGALIFAGNTATGATFSITNHTLVAATNPASSSNCIGLSVVGIANAVISGGSYTITNGGGICTAPTVGISQPTDASLSISGGTIENITVNNNGPAGGLGIFINFDSTGYDPAKAVGLTISGCTFTGGDDFIAGSGHAIFLNLCTDCEATGNTVVQSSLGFALKSTINSWHRNGISNNCTGQNLVAKGSTGGGFTDNTCTAQLGFTPSNGMLQVTHNQDDGQNTTGLTVTGNRYIVDGALLVQFVRTENASQTFTTLANNIYELRSGTLATKPFNWQGTDKTKAEWLLIEPTATFIGF